MYKRSELAAKYKEKLLTPEEAAGKIKSGDRVFYGINYAQTIDVDRALAARVAAGELSGLEIVDELGKPTPFEVFKAASSPEQVRFSAPFFSEVDRKMQDAGFDWFMPNIYSELGHIWRDLAPFDLCVIQVGPMDANGYFNIGTSLSCANSAIDASKTVILEVNENMPRAYGLDVDVYIGDVDYIVEGSNTPLPELPPVIPTDNDRLIAGHVVAEISSGATLQLGIGGTPNAIGKLLVDSDLGDFSCHSERLTEPFLDLYDAGKLTSTKNFHPGKITYAFAGGSQRLYDFIDGNTICEIVPIDYVTDFRVVSAIDKFTSINACVNVDLYGQVCSESAGYRHLSGTGGQLNFVMGACASKGGKSFLCCNSTYRNKAGELETNIRPLLKTGSVVTTPRSMVNYIVTEYGAVNLKGKTTFQRAEALISIAHPDFRDELIAEAEKMGLWSRTSKTSYR